MQKSVQITIIIVLGVLLLTIIGILGVSSVISPSKTISSYGEASITTIPDLVTIYFSIETSGNDLSKVQDQNTEISNALKTNLIGLGFEEGDIQTQNLYIGPKYRWVNGEQIQDGYEARHSLRLKMPADPEDISKIGSVIDAGIDAGASINYINFELTQEKQNEVKAEAIKQAAEDAKIKAEALAEGLGSELGKLVSVSSSNFVYSPWNIYSAREGATAEETKSAVDSLDIQPSEQEISATVTAVFRIR
jgi:uncharacterized protein YggE